LLGFRCILGLFLGTCFIGLCAAVALIKVGAKVVSYGRYAAFQMAEVAIPGNLFADILRMVAEFRPPAGCHRRPSGRPSRQRA
jgi:hypothetical protein